MNREVITSPQNPRIKAVAKLRNRRARGREDLIVIDGRREMTRAVDAGVQIVEIFHCPALCVANDDRDILQPAAARGARLTEVSEPVLGRISYGDRREGLVATAERPRIGLDDLRLSRCPIIGVVERIEKPGNLGAILRSADGAGVEALLAADPVTDIFGPNAIRASLGTVFCVPVVEITAERALAWLLSRHVRVVAADPAAEAAYTTLDLSAPLALVFGSEAEGLTAIWRQAGVIRASIPMHGTCDSLNAAMSAALFFYEAVRQRGPGPAEGKAAD